MKISETKQQVVGAIVFVSLFGVMALTYGAGSKKDFESDQASYLVQAAFNRIDGLVVGDDVMLGGVKMGTVVKARLDQNHRAILTLQLDSAMPLPADTSAAIHTDGLFGGKFISLEPGGDDRILKEGDTIDFTQDAVIVSDLLDLIIGQGQANLERQEAGSGN